MSEDKKYSQAQRSENLLGSWEQMFLKLKELKGKEELLKRM
jgi:hypothetical protein